MATYQVSLSTLLDLEHKSLWTVGGIRITASPSVVVRRWLLELSRKASRSLEGTSSTGESVVAVAGNQSGTGTGTVAYQV